MKVDITYASYPIVKIAAICEKMTLLYEGLTFSSMQSEELLEELI